MIQTIPTDLINKFIHKLKSVKFHHYVCERCKYSQGHQIIYCPKCPGKMIYRIEAEFDIFRRKKKAYQSLYYKELCTELNKGRRIDGETWRKIVDKIQT